MQARCSATADGIVTRNQWGRGRVQVLAEPRVLKERHLKLRLSQAGVIRDAMFFNGVDHELPRPPWDIAYTIDRNEFRGTVSVAISIQGVRKAVGK